MCTPELKVFQGKQREKRRIINEPSAPPLQQESAFKTTITEKVVLRVEPDRQKRTWLSPVLYNVNNAKILPAAWWGKNVLK